MQIEQKNKFWNKYKLDVQDVKPKVLSRSLLWMALGLTIIVFMAWISSVNVSFYNFVLDFSSGSSWLFAWMINIFVILALFLTLRNPNIPIVVPIILYSFFAVYEGIFITSILAFSGSTNIIKDLLLYLLIPAAIFGIMGVLSYFNLVNFTKLIPFIMFATFGLLIFALVVILSNNWYIEILYFILSAFIFSIWVGIDIQVIMRTKEINGDYMDKKKMNRLSFMFGINLFIDFVYLLYLAIRIFRN